MSVKSQCRGSLSQISVTPLNSRRYTYIIHVSHLSSFGKSSARRWVPACPCCCSLVVYASLWVMCGRGPCPRLAPGMIKASGRTVRVNQACLGQKTRREYNYEIILTSQHNQSVCYSTLLRHHKQCCPSLHTENRRQRLAEVYYLLFLQLIVSILESLEVASEMSISSGGQVILVGGTTHVPGIMDVAGTFTWKSGTLSGGGKCTR